MYSCSVCGSITPTPRCSAHTQLNPRNGSTRAWRTIRAAVLVRDHHTCQHCGAPASHAGHITAHANGGMDTMSNLHALCSTCNESEGAGQ
jgi:5-methylcytosine-specific restriction endonuclease McrA